MYDMFMVFLCGAFTLYCISATSFLKYTCFYLPQYRPQFNKYVPHVLNPTDTNITRTSYLCEIIILPNALLHQAMKKLPNSFILVNIIYLWNVTGFYHRAGLTMDHARV